DVYKRQLEDYKKLEEKYSGKVKFFYLIQSLNGHGQSYAINQGVLNATGTFIGFLDDDDYWIDNKHLARCLAAFKVEDQDVAIYCSLQEAWLDGKQLSAPIWLEKNLNALVKTKAKMANVYCCQRADLVANGAFAQVNVFVIRRAHFLAVGGFDENLRYECDREFYLRAVDAVDHALFTDMYVSKHHVPNPAQADNMSTAIQETVKLQYQLTLFTKLVISAQSVEVRREAKAGQGYTLKHMAVQLAAQKQHKNAARFAGMALLSQFSFKWLGYYVYLLGRSLLP
ncbi:MAG: glycosyltransferase, partial [Kordiimonadaceae bacterium]|nr:glycosyltransferase [Kordiimonadaceae bacterium]